MGHEEYLCKLDAFPEPYGRFEVKAIVQVLKYDQEAATLSCKC